MEVVVTKDQLQGGHACDVYSASPEWDSERQALVYSDWSATVARLLSTRAGTSYLGFLVARQLVPMTRDQFIEARNASREGR